MIKVDGISLPLDCNVEIKFNAESKESGLNKTLNHELVLAFPVPYTDISHRLYDKFGSGKDAPAYIGEPYFINADFRFLRMSDKEKRYHAELVISSAHDIIRRLGEFKICNLDLGTFDFTIDNILSYWNVANGSDKYNDGGSGVFPMYAKFNEKWKWEDNPTIEQFPDHPPTRVLHTSDLRLAISPLFILQKALCHANATFKCPVLESTRERHGWAYLYREKYWDYDGHGHLCNAKTTLSVDKLVTAAVHELPIPQDTIIQDNGGHLQPTGAGQQGYEYVFNPPVHYYDYKVKVKIKGQIFSDVANFVKIEVKRDINNNYPQYTETVNLDIGLNDIDVEFYVENTYIAHRFFTVIGAGSSINDPIVKAGFTVEIIAQNEYHYFGDIIDIAKTINPSLTVLDLLRDEMTLFDGLFEFKNNELFMSTAYPVKVQGEDVEGYYKPTLQKVDALCESHESLQLFHNVNENVLAFKAADDTYIKEKLDEDKRTENEKKYGVLSHYYEIGTDRTGKKERKLKLYQPSLNAFEPKISDNEEEPVCAIQIQGKGARRFYIYNGVHNFSSSQVGLVSFYGGAIIGEFPLIYQELVENYDLTTNPEFERQQLTMPELFNIYHKEKSKITAKSFPDSFDAISTYEQFKKLSFRNRIAINYTNTRGNNYTIYGRLKEKEHSSLLKPQKLTIIQEDIDNC